MHSKLATANVKRCISSQNFVQLNLKTISTYETCRKCELLTSLMVVCITIITGAAIFYRAFSYVYPNVIPNFCFVPFNEIAALATRKIKNRIPTSGIELN